MRWVCVCSHVPVLLSPSRQPLTELRSGQQLADLLWSSQQRAWTHLGLAASDNADTNTAVAQVCDGCPHPADATPPRRRRCAASAHEAPPAAPTQSSRRWSGDRWHWGASGSANRLHRKARRCNRHTVGSQRHPGCRRCGPASGTNSNPPSLSIPWRSSKESTCDARIHKL